MAETSISRDLFFYQVKKVRATQTRTCVAGSSPTTNTPRAFYLLVTPASPWGFLLQCLPHGSRWPSELWPSHLGSRQEVEKSNGGEGSCRGERQKGYLS